MLSIFILLVYITGVCASYTKLLQWNSDRIVKREDYQTLFALSLFSWAAFILYEISKLLNEPKEE